MRPILGHHLQWNKNDGNQNWQRGLKHELNIMNWKLKEKVSEIKSITIVIVVTVLVAVQICARLLVF
jgi:hypothetical protein